MSGWSRDAGSVWLWRVVLVPEQLVGVGRAERLAVQQLQCGLRRRVVDRADARIGGAAERVVLIVPQRRGSAGASRQA